MKCPNPRCNQDNLPDATFCDECGAALTGAPPPGPQGFPPPNTFDSMPPVTIPNTPMSWGTPQHDPNVPPLTIPAGAPSGWSNPPAATPPTAWSTDPPQTAPASWANPPVAAPPTPAPPVAWSNPQAAAPPAAWPADPPQTAPAAWSNPPGAAPSAPAPPAAWSVAPPAAPPTSWPADPTPGLGGPTAPAPGAWGIARPRFLVRDTGFEIDLSQTNQSIIGRSDPASNMIAPIDLAPHGGHERGVSRQHLQIMIQNGQAIIQDMGSPNGTTVNGQRMPARSTCALNDNDQVELGQLALIYRNT